MTFLALAALSPLASWVVLGTVLTVASLSAIVLARVLWSRSCR